MDFVLILKGILLGLSFYIIQIVLFDVHYILLTAFTFYFSKLFDKIQKSFQIFTNTVWCFIFKHVRNLNLYANYFGILVGVE